VAIRRADPRRLGHPGARGYGADLVHDALADFKAPLPRFIVELDDARRLLQPQRSPALEPADRRYLLDTVSELETALGSLGGVWQPLHGSPHAANWLPSEDGPLLLDFETAWQGPVEWDLAALADDALRWFPAADYELISMMRRIRSVCVAAKCWVSSVHQRFAKPLRSI
jgi:Ser/Thr protein kinase RdoA (MazF antagonist)